MSIGTVAVSVVIAAVVGTLVDWLLAIMLPTKPQGRHVMAVLVAIPLLALVYAFLSSKPDRIPATALATSAPPASKPVLSTSISALARIVVQGSDQDGTVWCVSSDGVFEISYESGAYSPWPTDEGCDPKGCWKGTIFVDRNSSPDSIFAGSSKGEPQDPEFQIGWNDWKKSREEVELVSKNVEGKRIELVKCDCLTFIAVDGRNAYHSPADNQGEVTLNVRLP